jgi:hypothetical protein
LSLVIYLKIRQERIKNDIANKTFKFFRVVVRIWELYPESSG